MNIRSNRQLDFNLAHAEIGTPQHAPSMASRRAHSDSTKQSKRKIKELFPNEALTRLPEFYYEPHHEKTCFCHM